MTQHFYFGPNPDDWNIDGDGKPGIHMFGNAVQVWARMNRDPSTVADAAKAFNCEPAMIIEAVQEHYWMMLSGPDDDYTKLTIEHEGE